MEAAALWHLSGEGEQVPAPQRVSVGRTGLQEEAQLANMGGKCGTVAPLQSAPPHCHAQQHGAEWTFWLENTFPLPSGQGDVFHITDNAVPRARMNEGAMPTQRRRTNYQNLSMWPGASAPKAAPQGPTTSRTGQRTDGGSRQERMS